MTVKEFQNTLNSLLDDGTIKEYDKVEIVSKLEKTANHYSVEYSPIERVDKVMIGVGVYIVGIVSK